MALESPALTIDEHLRPDGTLQGTRLSSCEGGVRIVIDGELDAELPLAVLDQVMARYGKPLAEDIALEGPRLTLKNGSALCMLRHRARYDVIARDFLVYVRTGETPLVELSTSVAAALAHLARAVGSNTLVRDDHLQ
ncbi:hypothetical protein LZC95_21680 [Pendulispora brunnea]|uniref:Uncharacterized protein n=1 Tax=Pendulispora brunnea TaxID=2905690 RepID=A0ABZ2KLM2_9BACT